MLSRIKKVFRATNLLPSPKRESAKPFYEFDISCQIPNLSMIIERYFPSRKGIFVEVGAYDGIKFSNTFGLVKRDWTGFLIEPDPDLYLKCIENVGAYKNIQVINKAVSSSNSKAVLHRQGPLSTLSLESHQAYKELDWALGESIKKSVLVECLTMDTILQEIGIQTTFDLLVVDVEGHEVEVFSSFDLNHWRPSMIIVELPDLHPDFPQLEAPYLKLKKSIEAANYSVIYKDHINTIFVIENLIDKKIEAYKQAK